MCRLLLKWKSGCGITNPSQADMPAADVVCRYTVHNYVMQEDIIVTKSKTQQYVTTPSSSNAK